MRYAEPSIETGIQKLVDQGISEIVLFLYILNMQ
jgi:ferrochelatase